MLYDTGGYPDNYTPDECFLAARRYNQNLVLYTMSQCVQGGAVVGHHIGLVIIFWCCYNFIKLNIISASSVTLAVVVLSALGYLVIIVKQDNVVQRLLYGIKTSVLFMMTGYSVSPVLYTLTDSISTDSLHTMASTSFMLHLLTTDYGVPAPVVSWQFSLNAAVFSSVCLASRFHDTMSAFSLLCLSLFCFLLLPLSRQHLVTCPISWSVVTSVTCLLLLSLISVSHTLLALVTLVTVQLICPLIFYHLQSYKQTIHGPWDEATPADT